MVQVHVPQNVSEIREICLLMDMRILNVVMDLLLMN